MILAKLASPVASGLVPPESVLEHSLENRVTLFTAPPGYLLTSHLAGLMAARHIPVVWIHVGPEDKDPATFLMGLAAGWDSIYTTSAARTLDAMRQQPGSVYGWPSLYRLLAGDIAEIVQSTPGMKHPAFVVDHLDDLSGKSATLSLFWKHFLPLLPPGTTSILIQHKGTDHGNSPEYAVQYGPQDLRINELAAFTMGYQAQSKLSQSSIRRLAALTEGRAIAILLLLALEPVLGSRSLEGRIQEAAGLGDLLQRAAREYLQDAGPDMNQMLGLAMQVGFVNPGLLRAALGESAPAQSHWLQLFQDSWMRLHCVSLEPLRATLPGKDSSAVRSAMERLADFFVQQELFEQAIPIQLDLGMYEEAAQALTQESGVMLDRGQWELLSDWISCVPERVRRDWPWLLYIQGEIAAASGREQAARHTFTLATQQFASKGDLPGVCQSLLMQSNLAALQNRLQESRQHAQQASTVADLGNLPWYQGWAGWQLGWLAALSGEMEDALGHFRRAAAAASALEDTGMAAFFGEVHSLAQLSIDLQQQIRQARQALLHKEQEQQETDTRLIETLVHPGERSAGLLNQYGWSRTPLLIKMSHDRGKFTNSRTLPSWFSDLIKALVKPGTEAARLPAAPVPALTQTKPEQTGPKRTPSPFAEINGPAAPPAASLPPKNLFPVAAQPEAAVINAYLLGDFRVMVNDALIENWPAGRSRSIFAFLLLQHGRQARREVLMDTFWPEAEPEDARNSLNVSMHNLRGVFRPMLTQPIILYQDSVYRIDPQINLWLDFVVFEHHVRSGGQVEGAGSNPAAIPEYEAAIHLYQGDFLPDHIYEEWAIMERERLRVIYLETLDHLSLVYFNLGRYDACVTLCQRMIAYDNCREDAHCRLMRCYYRQGQAYLALRQYQVCVEALHNELSVRPAPATVELYEQIRRRELI